MTICGNPKPRHGAVSLAGENIVGLPTHMLVRHGLAHAPEGRRIFARMSVLENLRMGAVAGDPAHVDRSEAHTSELQSLMRISYAVFWLKKQNTLRRQYIARSMITIKC